ncbi:MAG: PaaI family thioesterase [Rhodothalassiaceae bacterium]
MTPEILARLTDGEAAEVALDAIPYGDYLGASLLREEERILLRLRFDPSQIGAPGRLHGGVIGAALEFAAMAELMWQGQRTGTPQPQLPKPISLTVDFLRGGRLVDTFAAASITRRGRRVASVRALAWQAEEARPIAEGLMHFLVAGKG